jgi:hypothetical protein
VQEQETPHSQAAPQPQDVVWLTAPSVWQPQAQAAPGHDSQLHDLELFIVLSSLFFVLAHCQQPKLRIERALWN